MSKETMAKHAQLAANAVGSSFYWYLNNRGQYIGCGHGSNHKPPTEWCSQPRTKRFATAPEKSQNTMLLMLKDLERLTE